VPGRRRGLGYDRRDAGVLAGRRRRIREPHLLGEPRRTLVRRGVDPRGRRPLGPGATGAGLRPARGAQPRLVPRLEPRWAPAGPRALRWRPVRLGPARGAIPARRAGARLEMTRGGLPRSTHRRPRGRPRRVWRGRAAFGATKSGGWRP